jgi:WD40 repeat protein
MVPLVPFPVPPESGSSTRPTWLRTIKGGPPLVPDHEMLRPIGRGSYGEVWLARNIMGAFRAVKIVSRASFENDRPFTREFDGICRFEPVSRGHQHLIHVLQAGRLENINGFYYIMELADSEADGLPAAGSSTAASGSDARSRCATFDLPSYVPRTLKSLLARRGRLSVDQCLDIGVALAGALEYLHGHGLVHRDLKPANVVFVNDQPKLADVGLVTAATDAASFVGTEGYYPPEGPGSAQADIFSLGKVLYEISTGRDRNDFPELPNDLRENPERGRLLELNEIILKACQPNIAQRYASATQIRGELELLRAGRSVLLLRQQQVRSGRRRRLSLALVLLGFVALVLGGFKARFTARRQRETGQQMVALAERAVSEGSSLKALLCYAEAIQNGPQDERSQVINRLRWGYLGRQLPTTVGIRNHGADMLVAAMADTGETAATADADGGVKLWSLRVLDAVPTTLIHPRQVRLLQFDRTGHRLLTAADDGVVRVWDVATGGLITVTSRSGEAPRRIEIDTAGNRFFTIGQDQCVSVYEANTGALLCPALAHALPLRLAHFDPSGHRVLTASGSVAASDSASELRLWSVDSGQLAGNAIPHSGPVLATGFSHDGAVFFAAGADQTVSFWNAQTLAQLPTRLKHESPVMQACFTADDQRLITATVRGAIRIWDWKPGQQVGPTMNHPASVESMVMNASGALLMTCGSDQAVRLWNVPGGKQVTMPLDFLGKVRCAGFSAQDDLVTCGPDRNVRLWQLPTNNNLSTFAAAFPVHHLSQAPNRHRMAISGGPENNQGSTWIIDGMNSQAEPVRLSHRDLVLFSSFSPDGTRIATASMDHTARIWDARSGKPLSAPLHHEDPVWQVAFSPDGSRLATACGQDDLGKVQIWESGSGLPAGPALLHSNPVMSVCFSPDGKWLVSSEGPIRGAGLARIWSVADNRFAPFTLAHQGSVWCAAFSPDGARVLTTSLDQTARLWDSRSGNPVGLPMKHAGGVIRGVFSRDGSQVVTVSLDATARVWDANSGAPVTPPLKHAGSVQWAEFSPNGWLVATASDDHAARVWDAQTGEPVTPPLAHDDSVTCLAWSADGRQLFTASLDRLVRSFRLDPVATPARQLTWQTQQMSGRSFDARGAMRPQ